MFLLSNADGPGSWSSDLELVELWSSWSRATHTDLYKHKKVIVRYKHPSSCSITCATFSNRLVMRETCCSRHESVRWQTRVSRAMRESHVECMSGSHSLVCSRWRLDPTCVLSCMGWVCSLVKTFVHWQCKFYSVSTCTSILILTQLHGMLAQH